MAALKIADRAVIIDVGEVVFNGDPKDLLEDEALRLRYLSI